MKSSGINLLHANGDLYALFALFRAEMKRNKLVTWKWTPFCVVCTVSSEVENGTSLLHAIGLSYAWVTLFGLEETCRMRMDMASCSSHCLALKRIGTSLLHENGHYHMRFLMFGDETKCK